MSGHVKRTFVPDESEGRSVRTKMTESTEVSSPQILAFVANVIRDSHPGMAQEVKKVVESRRKEQTWGERVEPLHCHLEHRVLSAYCRSCFVPQHCAYCLVNCMSPCPPLSTWMNKKGDSWYLLCTQYTNHWTSAYCKLWLIAQALMTTRWQANNYMHLIAGDGLGTRLHS